MIIFYQISHFCVGCTNFGSPKLPIGIGDFETLTSKSFEPPVKPPKPPKPGLCPV